MRPGDEDRAVRVREADVLPTCPGCGRPFERAIRAQHFGLSLIANALVYGGMAKNIGPVQARIMETLMEHGQASRAMLGSCLNDDAMRKTVDVHICKLRPIIADLTNREVRIETATGWGYKLGFKAKAA